MKVTKAQILATNLTSHGYSNYDEVSPILSKLSDEELNTLCYAIYRTAEKSGLDYFNVDEIVNEGF